MKHNKAVAIGYNPGDYSPKVLARGMGHLADMLVKIAAGNGVPVIESADLANALSGMDPFDDVPEKYWMVVAEILKFVYETRGVDELH